MKTWKLSIFDLPCKACNGRGKIFHWFDPPSTCSECEGRGVIRAKDLKAKFDKAKGKGAA